MLQDLDRRLRLWNERRRRHRQIASALPDAIDLWMLVLQAGLDFQVALAQYLLRAPRGPLWEELSKLQLEIRTGVSRAQALEHLSLRVPEPSLQETLRSIMQALVMGTSLSPVLRAQAQALRKRRAYQAEKRAAVAPLKLLFPLLVFIFPTILVILFAPMVLTMGPIGFP